MNNKHLPKPELLLKIIRGNTIESLHYGWICVLNKDKKVTYKKGNIYDYAYLRSVAKPIQAISIIENKIKITDPELAIVCASHSGSEKHLKLLKSILRKHSVSLSDLKCGIHWPSDEKERKKLIRAHKAPMVLHNNCSGKHMGMLAVCKKNNWDLKTYLNISHPLQKLILSKMKDLSETKKIFTAIDGCSAPTFALPIINIAKMFSNFTNLENPENKKYSRIISAMKENPYIIGGGNQIDSEIIKTSKGNLISKVGAEGILVAAHNGNVALIKIADGSQRARSIVMVRLLIKLNWLKESDIKNSNLKEIYNLEIKNLCGKIVGEVKILD